MRHLFISRHIIFTVVLAALAAIGASAQQFQVNADYHTRSNFAHKGHDDPNTGAGDMTRFSLKYNQPLSLKFNELHQPTTWALTLHGSYAYLDDEGTARLFNPEKILNAGATITYLTPISEKWSIMASLGAGIYSQADHLRF